MKRLLLWLVRLFDDTAFLCVWCRRLRTGPGERVPGGWVCCAACSEAFWAVYESEVS